MSRAMALLRVQALVARANLADTLSGVASAATYAVINLIAVVSLLHASEGIMSPWILLLTAGSLRLGWSLAESITENLWSVGEMARSGELVFYKMSPISPLLHLTLARVQYERLLDALWGGGYILSAFIVSDLQDPLFAFAIALLITTLAFFTFFSITLLGASVSILTASESGAWMSAFAQIGELGLFPAPLYRKIMPEAVMLAPMFMPGLIGTAMLDPPNSQTTIYTTLSIIITISFFALSYMLWVRALNTYDGAGS